MKMRPIPLPEPLVELIERQLAENGGGSVSDYLQALVLDATRKQDREAFEAHLMAGYTPPSSGDTEAHRQQFRQHRIEEIRRLLAPALEELERGEGIPMDDVFRELKQLYPASPGAEA